MATARYAFWRASNGRADCSEPPKNAPLAVLKELGEMSDVTPNGGVSWNGFFIHQLQASLGSAFVILEPSGEELNEHNTRQILHGAIVDTIKAVGGKKALSEQKVRKAADARAATFFRQPSKDYALVASLSVAKLPFKSVRLAGCKIQPLKSRKLYAPPEAALRDSVISSHLRATAYSLVKVSVNGRSLHEAAARGVFALDLLRAFWSFFSVQSWRISWGRRNPIGVIYPGPIYTLHDKGGGVAADVYWYDRHVREDRPVFTPTADKWKKIDASRRRFSRLLNGHRFRHALEGLIVRYVEALDQPDFEVAFLKFWSILEQVTDSIGQYEKTVERAGKCYEDHQLVKGILDCLRIRRNLYVHSAKEGRDTDQAVFLVKGIVESHLLDLLRNPDRLSTIEEYARRLARSRDLEILRKEHRSLGDWIRALEKQKGK